MSHIVTIKTKIRDANAVRSACSRLHLPSPVRGEHRLFGGQATGLGVQLPGWRYPLVCQLNTGELRYDNYNGRWGEESELKKFRQAYATEVAKHKARQQGFRVSEQQLSDGTIRLTCHK